MDNNRHFCVYCHINKITQRRYIGLTGEYPPSKRWGYNGINYKNCVYFYYAIQKYGWDNFEHLILNDNLTQEEAKQLESYYIKLYNTLSPNGYNLTLGGDYPHILAPETKEKMRQSHLGKQCSEQTKINMSIARQGHIGYNKKAVWMCDKVTHKRLKYFASMTEAEQYLNKKHAYAHIGHVCQGQRPSAYGYFWEYAEKEE